MAACTDITYQFEELALLTEGKRTGFFTTGEAQIAVYGDDEWHLRKLWIDGIEIEKDAEPWIWRRVHIALEEQCHDDILEQAATEGRDLSAAMGWKFRSVA